MADEKDDQGTEPTGKRSPSYPGLDLEEAINKARAIWDKDGKVAAPMDSVAKHWGLSEKASPFLVAISALRKYGLVDNVNDKGQKAVRLSKLAMRIILPENEADGQKAIQEAALKPEIFSEFWALHNDGVPSDNTLISQLINQRNFTKGGAATFVKTYKETIAFANLKGSGTLPEGQGRSEGEEGQQQGVLKMTPPATLTQPVKNPSTGQISKTIVIPPGSLGDALLQLPAQNLPKSKFEYIKRFLEMIEEQLTSEEAKGQS